MEVATEGVFVPGRWKFHGKSGKTGLNWCKRWNERKKNINNGGAGWGGRGAR